MDWLKSMKPPASAALLSPGLAKKIVSTSNTAFSKQPLSFPTNQGAMSSATKCPALTFVKVMAVVDGPKAAIATKHKPAKYLNALAARRFSTFEVIRELRVTLTSAFLHDQDPEQNSRAGPPVLWTAYGRNLTKHCLHSPAG
jgi:hypothetical protein